MASTLRSNSREKWIILAATCTLWIASYFCILCNSALEDDMITTFNLSNTQFASFTTISFGFAMFGSLFTPYIIQKISLYNTMLLSCICELNGQTIFIVGILLSDIDIMYIGRIFIGFGYGIQTVTVFTTVNIWFDNNQMLPFAIHAVLSTYEVGILLTRFCMQPLYRYSNQLSVPFCIGILLAFISIIGCFVMKSIEKRFINTSVTNNTNSIVLSGDFKEIKNFNLMIWLIMIIIFIGWASIETFGTQFTVPIMTAFNVTEWYADILLAAQSIYDLTVGQICSYYISKYGFLSYYLISSMFFTSISIMILYFYDIDLWNITNVSPVLCAWMVMSFYIVGIQHYSSVAFSCLFMICPLELTSIVNSVTSIGFMAASTLQSYWFGVIADLTESYSFSILMCLGLLLFGLIIALIVHCMDVFYDGPLHKVSISVNSSTETDEDVHMQFIHHSV